MWDLPDQNGSPPAVPPTEWTRLKQPEPGAAGGFGDEDEELVGQGKLRGAESVVRRLLQVRAKEPYYQQKEPGELPPEWGPC